MNNHLPERLPRVFNRIKALIKEKHPHQLEEKIEEAAQALLAEIAERLENGDSLAFISYEDDNEIILTQIDIESIDIN